MHHLVKSLLFIVNIVISNQQDKLFKMNIFATKFMKDRKEEELIII